MKKYILTSLLIHSLALIPVALGSKQATPEAAPFEIEMVEQKSEEKGEDSRPIIEMGESGESQEELAFYWGLGITSNYINGMAYIESVASGYCAEEAGILAGDLITSLNGGPLSDENGIRGDGPKKLNLTISRNGSIIKLIVERCKVYY